MASKKGSAKLERLEKLLDEAGYVTRFEKGNFNSGYCVLEHKKVIVINKFLDQEGRCDVITELVPELEIDKNRLSAESKRSYQEVCKSISL